LRRKASLVLSIIVLVLLLLVVGGVLFIKSDFAADRMCNLVREGLSKSLGLKVSTEACSIDLLPPTLEVLQLKIDDQNGGRLLDVGRLKVELDSLALLTGRIRLDKVVLVKPEIHLAFKNGAFDGLPQFSQEQKEQKEDGSNLVPEQIAIENGRIYVIVDKLALVQLTELQAKMIVKDEQHYEIMLDVGGGGLDLVGGRGVSVALEKFKVKVGIRENAVHLDHLALQVGELSLAAHGKIDLRPKDLAKDSPGLDLGFTPELNISLAVPLNRLQPFIPDIPKMQGTASVSLETSRAENGLQGNGSIDVKGFGIESAKEISFQSNFSVDREYIKLESLSASGPPGTVTGKAQLALTQPWEFSGSVSIEKSSLYESLVAGGVPSRIVDLQAAGNVDFNGKFKGKYGPYIILNSRLSVENIVVSAPNGQKLLELPKGKLRAKAAFTGRRVRFPPLRLEIGDSLISAEGKIYFNDGSLKASLTSESLDLEDFSPLAAVNLAGTGTLALELVGSIHQASLAATLDIEGLKVEGHPVGSVKGSLTLSGNEVKLDKVAIARRAGMIWLNGSLGTQAPYPLDLSVDLRGAKLREIVSVATGKRPPTWLSGLVGGHVQASGTLESPALDFKIGFKDVRLGQQVIAEGGMLGRVQDGAWHLDLFEARLGTGWLFARGDISPDLELDLTAYSTGLRAASFQALDSVKGELDFRLDLNVSVKGPLRSPSFAGWAKAYDTQLHGQPVENSFVSAQATTESIKIKGNFLGGAAKLEAQARLEENLPFSATALFSTKQLGRFLPRLKDNKQTRGTVRGKLEASGLLLVPGQISGQLRFDEIMVQAVGLKFKNHNPVLLEVEGGSFEVSQCTIVGSKTAFSFRGGGSLQQGLNLRADGTIGLELLPIMVGFLPRVAGIAKVKLVLSGPWGAPQISGSAAFSAEQLRISGFSQDFSSITGQLRFTPSLIEITSLNGRLGGGTFSGRGNLVLEELAYKSLVLNLDVERVRYNVSKNLWGIGTGTLTLHGTQGQMIKLSGQVRIHEGVFREKYSLASLSGGIFKRRLKKAQTYSKKREVIEFDLRLIVPDSFRVSYNLELVNYQAEMGGELRLTGTNERLGLLGEIEAQRGTVNYLSKDFTIQSTRVRFADKYSISPHVEVLATLHETIERSEELGGTTEYQIDLRLSVQGDSKPEIILKSNPPLDERDIVTLLHLGITSSEVDEISSENLVGLGGEILFRSFKLDEKIRTMFPFPPEVIKPKYLRLRSRYSESSETTTPRLEFGAELTLISDDLELEYGRSLLDDTDQNLDLSYKLSKGISTRLRWRDSSKKDANEWNIGDLGLDLKFDWEW